MKTIVALLFFITSTLHAQDILPTEGSIMYDNGPRPALVASVDPAPKTLKKAWSDYMDEEYDVHLKGIGLFSNKDILKAEDASIDFLSNQPVDFFTRIIEKDDGGSEMKLFVRRANDIYISSELYPDEFSAVNRMMTSFLEEYLPKYHNELVNESYKAIEDLKDDIRDNQEDIQKLEKKLEDNRTKLQNARHVLENRTKRLERITQALAH